MKPFSFNKPIIETTKTKKLIKIGVKWYPLDRINLKEVAKTYLLMIGKEITEESINDIVKEF